MYEDNLTGVARVPSAVCEMTVKLYLLPGISPVTLTVVLLTISDQKMESLDACTTYE